MEASSLILEGVVLLPSSGLNVVNPEITTPKTNSTQNPGAEKVELRPCFLPRPTPSQVFKMANYYKGHSFEELYNVSETYHNEKKEIRQLT
jgi:hypothetical protein